jgi:hypothetical protein
MSQNLDNNTVAAFEHDAKDAYQSSGVLRGTVRTVTGVTGGTYRFHKIGKGLASPRIPQTEVVPMGITHGNATATLEDWIAAEYTDVFDEQKVSYSERKFLASTCGRAIARREDQLILDAFTAATIPAAQQIAKTYGTGGNELNLQKVRYGKRLMDELAIPSSDRHILLSAGGLDQMLGVTEATSSDFSNLRRLQDGEMGSSTWMGFNWHIMDDRAGEEGGYTISTNDVTTYMWHTASMGLAVGMDMKTDIDWVPNYTSHLTQCKYIGGAVAIDTEGIIQLTYDQSIAV